MLDKSEEYKKAYSLLGSYYISENEQRLIRNKLKLLENNLELDFNGQDRKAQLKELWTEVFQYAEQYDQVERGQPKKKLLA